MDTRIDPPKSSEGVCHACEMDRIVVKGMNKLTDMVQEEGIEDLLGYVETEKMLDAWFRESLPNVICADCAGEMGV